MKYFNWPECGEGSHSYTCSAGAQSQDYSTIRYSWTDMLDEYDDTATKRQQMAVGQLMYGAGVSVDMNYGTHASGAAAIRIPIALTSYFRYDRSMQYLERDYYLLSEWEQLIYDNLKSYGPVIYDGVGGQGGHSFVCDGYSSDGYFHFNWGWGGVSDGYFLLDLLDPIEQGIGGGESAFSYMQDCVLGIRPDRTGESVANPVLRMNQPLLTDVSEVSRQDEINWGGFVYNPGPCATGEGVVGLCFYGVSEDECHYLPIGFFDALEPMYGFGDLTAEIPEDIPDGRYEVKAVYQFGSEEDYAEERFVDVEVPLTGIRGILAEISGDEVTLSEIGPDLPTLLAFEYPETLASDEKARISARLANESGQAVFTVVVPILIGEDGTLAAYGSFTPIDLAAGEETGYDVETLLAAPRGRLPQGDYELHLCGYGAPYFFSLGDGVPIMITAPAMGVEEVEAGEERSAMSYGLGGLPARSSDRIVIKVAGNGVGEKVAGAPF